MNSIKDSVSKSRKYINDNLRKEFLVACKDEDFCKLCNRFNISEDIIMKYTSHLQDSVMELNNCKGCKGINECKNKFKGRVYYPCVYNDSLEFEYKECKYSKSIKKNNTAFFETPKILRNANLSDLWNEKERSEIIKYIKDFLKKKVKNENVKGLYLSGNFGSGKSYILSSLLNELSMKGYKCVNVYFPTLIQKLKMSMDDGSYADIIDEISTSDILLLDDIGAENNTSFTRDEILGTVLQYRMDNDLTTFFTSNYTLSELEEHLSATSRGNDPIKARRIIERIRFLTKEEKLISKNKRAEE